MLKKKKELKTRRINEMRKELTKRVKIYENLVHVEKEAKTVMSRFHKRKDRTMSIKLRFISLLKKLQRVKQRRSGLQLSDEPISDEEEVKEVNSELEESEKKIMPSKKAKVQKSEDFYDMEEDNEVIFQGEQSEQKDDDEEGEEEEEREEGEDYEELEEEEYNLIMQNIEVLNHIATMIQKVWRGYRVRKMLRDYFSYLINEQGVIFEEEDEMFDSQEKTPSKVNLSSKKSKRSNGKSDDKKEENLTKEILVCENENDPKKGIQAISSLQEQVLQQQSLKHGYFDDHDAVSQEDEPEKVFISDRHENENEMYEEAAEDEFLDNIPSTLSKKTSKEDYMLNMERSASPNKLENIDGIKVMSSSWSPLHSSHHSEKPENPSVFEEEPFLKFSQSLVGKPPNKEKMMRMLEARERLIEDQHNEDISNLKRNEMSSQIFDKRKIELEKWVSLERKEIENAKTKLLKGVALAPELVKKTKRDLQLAQIMDQKREVFSDNETRNLLLMSESDPFFSQSWGGSHKASHRDFETPGSSIKKPFPSGGRRGSDDNVNYDDQSGDYGDFDSPAKNFHNQSSPAYYSSPTKSEEINQLNDILSKVKELPKTISHDDICNEENDNAILIEEETKPQYLNEYKANYLTSLLLEKFVEEISQESEKFLVPKIASYLKCDDYEEYEGFDTGLSATEAILYEIDEELKTPEIMQEILARMNFYSNLEQIELLEVLKDQNFKPPKILPVPDLSDTPRSSFFLLVHNAYECVLEFIRKKETKMQVLPFPPKVRCFTDDELEKILDFSKQKVLEASSFQVGVLHERVGVPAGIEDQYLQQIRHERLEAMLSQEIVENEEFWLRYSEDEARVLMDMTELVMEGLVVEAIETYHEIKK